MQRCLLEAVHPSSASSHLQDLRQIAYPLSLYFPCVKLKTRGSRVGKTVGYTLSAWVCTLLCDFAHELAFVGVSKPYPSAESPLVDTS